jgi:putative acetyltransferase
MSGDAVVTTWRAASELAHPFLTSEFLEREADAVRNIYFAFAETWVTEIDGEVVGFIALVDDEIGGLFLHPKYHGQGYGKAMVDKAVADKGPLRVEVFKKTGSDADFTTRTVFTTRRNSFTSPPAR